MFNDGCFDMRTLAVRPNSNVIQGKEQKSRHASDYRLRLG